MTEHPPRDAAATDVVQQMEGAGESIRGTVRVAPAVLIQLIELTVSDIDGVVELRPRPKKTRQPHEVEGKSYDDGKVRVGVIGDRIETGIAVSVKHGVNPAPGRWRRRAHARHVGQLGQHLYRRHQI